MCGFSTRRIEQRQSSSFFSIGDRRHECCRQLFALPAQSPPADSSHFPAMTRAVCSHDCYRLLRHRNQLLERDLLLQKCNLPAGRKIILERFVGIARHEVYLRSGLVRRTGLAPIDPISRRWSGPGSETSAPRGCCSPMRPWPPSPPPHWRDAIPACSRNREAWRGYRLWREQASQSACRLWASPASRISWSNSLP